jgi:hypothetical protein
MSTKRQSDKETLVNIAEAQAAQRLLSWLGLLTRAERDGEDLIGRETGPAPYVREQAAWLADRAYDRLGKGLTRGDVEAGWARLAAAVDATQPEVCGARHPNRPELRCAQRMAKHTGWHATPGGASGPAEWVWALDAVRPGQARSAAEVERP